MKDPIESREIFYDTLRDGSMFFLDWCLVNTPNGAMVEPRPVINVDGGKIANADMYDQSFSRISPMDEDSFFSTLGTGGRQAPSDFNVP